MLGNEDRLDKMVYSEPIPGGKTGYLVNNDLDIEVRAAEVLDQLVKKLVTKDVTRLGLLRGSGLPAKLMESKALKKISVGSLPSLLDMLDKRRVDVVYIDQYSAKETIINYRPHLAGRFKFIGGLQSDNPYYLALSNKLPNVEELISRFNDALAYLKANGTVDKVLRKYGIYSEAAHSDTKLVIAAPDINAIETAIDYLNRQDSALSGIDIEWRIMNESILRKRLLGDFAVNEASFDLIMLGNFEVPIWARRNWLLPFTEAPENYDIEDLIPITRKAASYQQRLYGLPFTAETTLTFYRKDLLQQANITLPSPLTYNQLETLALSLHDPANELYGIGLRTRTGWGQNMALISTMVNAYGGEWFDSNMQPKLTSPAWYRAVSSYLKLINDSGPIDNRDLGWQENQQLFADGKLAFFVDASSLGGMLFDPSKSKVYDKVGFTHAPIGTTQLGAQWFWSWNFAVPRTSNNPGAAKNIAYWLTSKKYIQAVKSHYGNFSAPPGTRHSTYEEEYLSAIPFASYKYDALMATELSRLYTPTTGSQFVPIPEFTAIGYLVGAQINMVVSKQKSLEEALQTAQKQVKEVMRRAGYYDK